MLIILKDASFFLFSSYGIYVQSQYSLIIEDTNIIDTTFGVYSQLLHPDTVSHEIEDKFVKLIGCTFDGRPTHSNDELGIVHCY